MMPTPGRLTRHAAPTSLEKSSGALKTDFVPAMQKTHGCFVWFASFAAARMLMHD
jgi:hypothetical protein